MRIVGLTGGIACGKSTVTKQLLKKGVAIVDCDKIGKTGCAGFEGALDLAEHLNHLVMPSFQLILARR